MSRLLLTLGLAAALTACSTASPARTGAGRTVQVVTAENSWGSLASQLGGSHAHVTSIISNPDADPHSYEPTASDARAIATADLAVVNGVGYDTWASKLLAASPSRQRKDLTVGRLVGVPSNGNPHRWYAPDDVRTVVDAMTAALIALDPADSADFARLHDQVLTVALKDYFGTIAGIKATYGGTPVGASESIFAPLADALGLRLVTPESFLDAVSEGTDPTAQDKATIDAQIAHHAIKVYVYNTQNATPDVQAQVVAARRQGIQVVGVTETLTPAGSSFQQWQVAQLRALQAALAKATGQ